MNATVAQHMATQLVTFNPDDDIIDAMRVLLEKRLSGAPVVDKSGRVVGVLSKKDCLAIVYNTAYHQHWGGKVEQYMSREVGSLIRVFAGFQYYVTGNWSGKSAGTMY